MRIRFVVTTFHPDPFQSVVALVELQMGVIMSFVKALRAAIVVEHRGQRS